MVQGCGRPKHVKEHARGFPEVYNLILLQKQN